MAECNLISFSSIKTRKKEFCLEAENEDCNYLGHLESRAIKTTIQAENLGAIMDWDLSFTYHNKAIMKSKFLQLKSIAEVRDFV